jgi:steroid 5-alpha reductase family enzyme
VDSVWSLLLWGAALSYAWAVAPHGPRFGLVLLLVTIWALRLALYITWRNRGQGEDRRYQQIRQHNEPGFVYKSLYIVFGLQGALAWIISLPLLAAVAGEHRLGWLDALGAALWAFGFAFEAIGDTQLARFKAQAANVGKVMDRGLWRHTRHPNYFGECCLWWGFYLIALSAGWWWSIVSPVLMSVLLLRVSGVTLLEKDIGERRPGYRAYIERTSAFFPWTPKTDAGQKESAS